MTLEQARVIAALLGEPRAGVRTCRGCKRWWLFFDEANDYMEWNLKWCDETCKTMDKPAGGMCVCIDDGGNHRQPERG